MQRPGQQPSIVSPHYTHSLQLMHTRKTSDLSPCPPLVLPEGSTECARQCRGRSGRRAVDSGGLPELPGAGKDQEQKIQSLSQLRKVLSH